MAQQETNRHESSKTKEMDEATALEEWFSVSSTNPTHYELLGVDPSEWTITTIDEAAKARVRILNGKLREGYSRSLCQRLDDMVLAARATLIDPEKRASYDKQIFPLAADPFGSISLNEPFPSYPPPLSRRRPSAFERVRNKALVIGGAILGVVGGAVYWARQGNNEAPSPDSPRPAATATDALPPPPVTKPQQDTRASVEEVTAKRPIAAPEPPPPPPPPPAPAPAAAETVATDAAKAPALPSQTETAKPTEVAHDANAKQPIPSKAQVAALRGDPSLAPLLEGGYRDLLARSQKTQDPVARWVLLADAYRAAVEENDAEAAWAALEAMSSFDVKPADLARQRLKAFTDIFPHATGPQRKQLLAMIPDLLRHGVAYDLYDQINAIAATAKPAQFRDPALRARLASLQEKYEETAEARAALAQDPENAQACETMGSYYAFVKGDGQMAAPYLAKAANGTLNKLGKQMEGGSTDAGQCFEIAQALLRLAEEEQTHREGALRMAAAYFHRTAARCNAALYLRTQEVLKTIPHAYHTGATPFHPLLAGERAEGAFMQRRPLAPNPALHTVLGKWTDAVGGQKLPGVLSVSGVQTDSAGVEIASYLYPPADLGDDDYVFWATVQQPDWTPPGQKPMPPDALLLDLPVGPPVKRKVLKHPGNRFGIGLRMGYGAGSGIYGPGNHCNAQRFLQQNRDPRNYPDRVPQVRLEVRVFVRQPAGVASQQMFVQVLRDGTLYTEFEGPISDTDTNTHRHIPPDAPHDGIGLVSYTTPALFTNLAVAHPFRLTTPEKNATSKSSRRPSRTDRADAALPFGVDGVQAWVRREQQNQLLADDVRKQQPKQQKRFTGSQRPTR